MAVEVKVPQLGESVTEAVVANWMKKPGDAVAVDEAICELETDKVTLEVNSPVAGALSEILADEGAEVEVGALLATIEEGAAGSESAPAKEEPKAEAKQEEKQEAKPASPPPPPAAQPAAKANLDYPMPPAVKKLVEDNALDASKIPASGKDGRLTKADVVAYMQGGGKAAPRAAAPAASGPAKPSFTPTEELPPRPDHPLEERVKMTKLRKVIASRLKEAQNTAAMLTTWNDVDMTRAMEMRAKYKDAFEKKHGVRLGFMSMFVRAACIALKEWPAVNAEIYGDELIYKNYYNIGVAVGTPNGLVVPVLKDADEMSFAGIEGSISDFGRRARDGKLTMDEMMGGTFTISNGGVFGSMSSMPIINVPQAAIMGMHRIEKRPVAIGDEVVIRPMMYLALSYDHRIIDGREAVSFLVRIKQCIEDPGRILLDV